MKNRRLSAPANTKPGLKRMHWDWRNGIDAEIADAFLVRVEEAEALLSENNYAGTDAPYLLAGQHVVLKELYFGSGPYLLSYS